MAKLSTEYVDHIAKELDWNSKGVIWYADLADKTTSIENNFEITVRHTNKNTFDIYAVNSHTADMNQVIDDFKDKFAHSRHEPGTIF